MITSALDKSSQDAMNPQNVLSDLHQGNKRFQQQSMRERDYASQRKHTVSGQYPKAVVLSCIDSRVPVETIFDQGIGDIFVARVAGNFENTDILGSLEYSCKVAGSKLILVLGHEACGAVKAACDGVELGNITPMLANITPAVRLSAEQIDGPADSSNSEFVAATVKNNVKLTMDRIRERSAILREMEDAGEISIKGGVYQLGSGEVEFL